MIESFSGYMKFWSYYGTEMEIALIIISIVIIAFDHFVFKKDKSSIRRIKWIRTMLQKNIIRNDLMYVHSVILDAQNKAFTSFKDLCSKNMSKLSLEWRESGIYAVCYKTSTEWKFNGLHKSVLGLKSDFPYALSEFTEQDLIGIAFYDMELKFTINKLI